MKYTEFEHQHRFAVWAAARAAQRGFTTVELLKDALEQTSISEFAKDIFSIQTPEAFAIKHKEWCCKIEQFLKGKGLEKATYGRAAKLVAVYLKSMIVLPRIKSEQAGFIHPPIDRILLQNIAKQKKLEAEKKEILRTTNWTQLDEDSYFRIIGLLQDIFGRQPLWKMEEHWTII